MRGILVRSMLVLLLLIPYGYVSTAMLLFLRYGDLPSDWGAPYSLAVDKQGYIYVTTSDTSSLIYKLNSAGKLAGSFKNQASSYGGSVKLAVSLQGQLYLHSDKTIMILNPENNEVISQWEIKVAGPYEYIVDEFAIDTQGNVYIINSSLKRVQKYDSQGHLLGERGVADDQSFNINSIDVNSQGYIYVSDSKRHIIQNYDPMGQFITEWKLPNQVETQYWSVNLTVDKKDNLYVTDAQNNRIQKFDKNGHFLEQGGSEGGGQGELYYPRQTVIDQDGNSYIIDSGNHRIQKFDPKGKFIWESNPHTWEEKTALINGILLFWVTWLPWYYLTVLAGSFIIFVWRLVQQWQSERSGLSYDFPPKPILPGKIQNDYWYLVTLAPVLCVYCGGGIATINAYSTALWFNLIVGIILCVTVVVIFTLVEETFKKLKAR